MTYNPSAPNTIGVEWRPTLEQVTALSSILANAGFTIVSTVAETIDQLVLPFAMSGPASGHGRQWLDVYDTAAAVTGPNPAVLTYFPNEDKATAGTLRWENQSSTGSFWARIDDAANDSSAEADYMMNMSTTAPASWRGQFNTAAIPNTRRVVSVTFQVRAKGFDWATQAPSVVLEWWDGSTKLGNIGTIYPPKDYQFRNYTLGPFYLDWFNGGPWLQPEIANLDVNTSRNLGVTLNYSAAVSRIAMEVAVVDETRVAVGVTALATTVPAGAQTATPYLLKTPLNADNWAKASAKTYLFVARRLDDPFAALPALVPQPLLLDSASPCPRGQGGQYTVTIENQGGNVLTWAAAGTKTYAPVLGRSDGAQSVDSQPYWDLDAKAVYWDVPASQAMSAASAQSYRRLRALVAVGSTAPDVPLCVGVRRTSTVTASESWTGSNGASWPAQWTEGSGTTGAAATIQSNAGQQTTGTTTSGYHRHRLNLAVGPNFMATQKVTFASVAAVHSARVFFRGAATWTAGVMNSSYEVRLVANSNLVELYRYNGSGVPTQLKSQPFTVTAAQHSIKIVCLSQGTFGVKVWLTANAEPASWTFSYFDATNNGTGYGLGVLGGSGDATSDTITWDDLATYDYLSVGDLTAADLAVSTIATSKGPVTFGNVATTVYDVVILMDNAATLAGSTDYTLDMVSIVAPSKAWYVLWLDSTGGHSLTGNQTYAGATDAAAWGAAATTPGADFVVSFGSVPSALTGLTVTATTVALPNSNFMDYAAVAWNASALGAGFGHYELERSTDTGATWVPVGTGVTEATAAFADYSAPSGVALKYRVRVVRSDEAPADWTTQAGTTTLSMSSGLLVFTSNRVPSITTGFWILGNELDHDFLNAEETIDQRMLGRDFQVTFKPLEQRGFRWPFTIVVHSNRAAAPAAGAGLRGWNPIRAVADADVPYVCVKTADGERFFGSVRLLKGKRLEPAHLYLADVVFTQGQADDTAVEF